MDNWETSGKSGAPVGKDQWEGEDEEEDVLDSWDQEEPVDAAPPDKPPPPVDTKELKKKKKERVVPQPEEKPQSDMTPEELLADKLYRQKLQEESDLVLAKEIFGVSSNGTLESKEDFQQFEKEISAHIATCAKNSEYVTFTEQLVQSLCLHLGASDLKRIHNVVGNLHIEKLKLEKGDKAKKSKSKSKVKLRMDEETDYNEFSAYTTDEFDFI